MLFIPGRKKDNSGLQNLEDHELIHRYRQGADPGIIEVLFSRYTHLVYGVCLKYLDDKDDAKDAVMEIFEGLIDDIPEYEIRNFKSWLHSVTRNHCLMKIRKDKTVRLEPEALSEKSDEIFVETGEDMHHDIKLEEYTIKELESAMGFLKEPQRLCIELVYLRGKSYAEVCEITGYSVNDVKSHVQNGKRNLRIRLESRNVGKI
jgi:RNA polymerase sigma factor (sigma-70 family)